MLDPTPKPEAWHPGQSRPSACKAEGQSRVTLGVGRRDLDFVPRACLLLPNLSEGQ